MTRALLIDTDTASDDAIALVMALRSPHVRVVAITTVAGNVGVSQATRNALYTVELCGAKVPVHVGAEKPIARAHQSADWFHGRDGLGDHSYPAARQSPSEVQAVDAIISAVEVHPGLVVVTLGPLTNIALALAKKPEIVSSVGRCVVMGGAPCCEGNVTPAAEYNMWVDPEAARIVMRSGLPVELIGWQLCRGEAVLRDTDIVRVLHLDTDVARFAIECNSRAREAYREQTGEDGISLPDPVAMSIALDPEVGTAWSAHYVDIETESELTRGMTVVDKLNVARDDRNRDVWALAGKVKVCWAIDIGRWKDALFRALGSLVLLVLSTVLVLRAQVILPQVIQKVDPKDDPKLTSFLVDPVRVEVTVDDAGTPVFLRSAAGLPDNVVTALAEWRFRPGTKDGKKVAFALFIDAQVKRPMDRYVGAAFRDSDKPWERVHYGPSKITPENAVAFEQALNETEASVSSRAQLLRYAAGRKDPEAIEMRAREISWLVWHQPGAEVLSTPAALIFSSDPLRDPAAYERVKNLWLEQVSKDPKNAVVLGHAAWFMQLNDPEITEKILVSSVDTVGGAAARLGRFYAYTGLGVRRLGLALGEPTAGEKLPDNGYPEHARSMLAATGDQRVLLSALDGVITLGRGLGAAHLPAGYAEFCNGLLLRVKAFYPDEAGSCTVTATISPPQAARTMKAARLIKQQKPEYPKEARLRGIQGTVSFAANIGKDGRLHDVELLSGPLVLYSASRAAILKWEYEPLTVDGMPADLRTILDVNFALSR